MPLLSQFANDITTEAVDEAVADVLGSLESLPKGADQQLSQAKAWFDSLDAGAKEHLRFIVSESARVTAFGYSCILDGARTISPEFSELTLTATDDAGNTHQLLPSEMDDLHDYFAP